MRIQRFICLAWLVAVTARGLGGEVSAPPAGSPPGLPATLKAGHPRLLATAKEWDDLRVRRTNDATLAQLLGRIEHDGREMLSRPTLTYEKEGRRLLAVSREALSRIITWGFCRRLTGDPVFAERAQREMLTLAAFPDWNPSHFLDTAEMTAALAIGYDWLYDQLTPSARETIRRAIVDKGLRPAVGSEAKAAENGWQKREMNWNQVCFGGLTLGALAVADEDPQMARALLVAAQRGIVHGLKPYAPDGVYPEGPGYWEYGTVYQVLMIAALESALGDGWKLAASPGFLASAGAQLQQTGPTRKPYNFFDGTESRPFTPVMFWFAQRLRQPELLFFQQRRLAEVLARGETDSEGGRFLPLIALWWGGGTPPNVAPSSLPLGWLGNGANPVGVFRSSWTDPGALYLAFKGGSAGLAHGHMDAGSFILEADGVRWACDLGRQEYYSIESKGWNLWSREQTGDRWRVYRLNNFSHNTLTIGGQLHRVKGDARIVAFDANSMSAAVNLTDIFAGQATNVVRHFQLGNNREVRIRDELSGLKPGGSVRWQLVTHAKVTAEGDRAVLRQDGKVLHAQRLAPAGADFEVVAADPPGDGVNQPNPNTRILLVNARVPEDGRLQIEVSLCPGSSGQPFRGHDQTLPQ